MTNRAVQIYDDNPEMIKLKSDINDIQNWKVVRESFRQFKAARPGPNVIVRNYATGICYRTTDEYPWVINGIKDEVYVDSDDLKLEDLLGHPVNLDINRAVMYRRGYSEFRVAGAKHQYSLKGSSTTDLQNCRQFYAFYLNPNKYDAKALSEFTLTVDNEYSKGSIRNGAVKKQIYGLGNFLICRTYGEMHKPDFTTIDLIPGDAFIQRFNAKPFGLKKIDEAIEQYKIDTIRGNVDGFNVCKESELPSIRQNFDERKQRVQESEDKINKADAEIGISQKNDKDLKDRYTSLLEKQMFNTIRNLLLVWVIDYDMDFKMYDYSNIPNKVSSKISGELQGINPDILYICKVRPKKKKFKLKLTFVIDIDKLNKCENGQYKALLKTCLVAAVKQDNKKYKRAIYRKICDGDCTKGLDQQFYNDFMDIIQKLNSANKT